MTNTYSWIIAGLECYPEQEGKENVVCTVNWRRQATDGAHTADVYGSQALTLDPGAHFVAFDNLTPKIIEGWLESAMGDTLVSEIDSALARKILEQISPAVKSPPLPWS